MQNSSEVFNKEKVPARAKILVIKLRSIGDVIYNTAVYAPLKKSFPDSHLTVIVEPPSYDIVKDHPAVDKTLCFEKKGFFQQLGFYWRLFAERYDVVIDMHEGPRGALMCFVTRAQFRIGHKFAKRSFLYNVKLSFEDLKPQYPIDYQAALIRKMGVDFDEVSPAIFISESSRARADKLLSENGIRPEDSFCILHPGARKFDCWKPERFARLAEYSNSRYGVKVIFTCGQGQEGLIDEIRKHMGKMPLILIQTGLQELAAITEKARFVVCHNGGYMHLAATVGAPVVAMFGWANPKVWKPVRGNSAVIYKNLDCSPCSSTTIRQECLDGDPECKRLITVDDVLEGINNVTQEKTLSGE